MLKKCKECNIDKDISEYPLKSNGKLKNSFCKKCYNERYYHSKKDIINENRKDKYKANSEKILEERKLYYNDNKDYIKERRKELYQLNKEKHSKKRKEYYEKNKDIIKEKNRDYYYENRETINEERRESNRERSLVYYYKNKVEINKKKSLRDKNRMISDPLFKLSHNIRTLIRKSFKNKFTKKSKKTVEILGCSFEEFKSHLESKFDDKMNWDNQGSYWHLDHIIPVSSANNKEELYRLNHYTNFQPLFWLDNLKKSNNLLT